MLTFFNNLMKFFDEGLKYALLPSIENMTNSLLHSLSVSLCREVLNPWCIMV